MLTVYLEYDANAVCPGDGDDYQWSLYSFCARHWNFKSPEDLGLVCTRNALISARKPLQAKLGKGLAFVLSYFEHGHGRWFRMNGPTPAGVEFRWDGVRVAGLLIWEHHAKRLPAKTYEERAASADSFLEAYSNWLNGEAYSYRIESEDGELLESDSGFLGDPGHMLDAVASLVANRDFEVRGSLSHLSRELLERVERKRKLCESS